MSFTQFKGKIRATKMQKSAKFALLAKCFSNLFTEAEIFLER